MIKNKIKPLKALKKKKASTAPHFENINSSALSLLYGPTLTSIYDCLKNQSFN